MKGGPEWFGRWNAYAVSTSGREEGGWPHEAEFWSQFAALFSRHNLTLEGAKDVTRAARAKVGNWPADLYRGIASILDDRKQPNLPAAGAQDTPPCPLCGFQGLVPVEHTDGSPIQARVGGITREMRSTVAACSCPHGNRVLAGHKEPPWPSLDRFDRRRWQPVGGWPDAPAPAPATPPTPIKSLAAALAEAEDDYIPF